MERKILFRIHLEIALQSFDHSLGTNAVNCLDKQILQKIPTEKPVRRALKQALYRLERHGLVTKDEETESEPRVLIPRPADRQSEAWASWPESQGERGMVLKLPDAGRGYVMAIAVVQVRM